MRNVRVSTSDESVERIQPVNEVSFNKKLECAIDRRRCRPVSVLVQPVENVVSADRFVAAPDQAKNVLSMGRKPEAPLAANAIRVSHRLLDTIVVVMFAGLNSFGSHRIRHCRNRHLERRIVAAFERRYRPSRLGSDTVFCTIARDPISLIYAEKNAKNSIT